MLAWLGVGGFVFVMSVAFVESNGWTTGVLNFFAWGGMAALATFGIGQIKRRLE